VTRDQLTDEQLRNSDPLNLGDDQIVKLFPLASIFESMHRKAVTAGHTVPTFAKRRRLVLSVGVTSVLVLSALAITDHILTSGNADTHILGTGSPGGPHGSCNSRSLSVTMRIEPEAKLYSSSGLKGVVSFYNTGATCLVEGENPAVIGTRGPDHATIGIGALSGATYVRPIILHHDASVTADFEITRTNEKQCIPKMGDGLEVTDFSSSGGTRYFRLPRFVGFCSGISTNVASGLPKLGRG
jgi:hypothetical protein